MLFRSMVHRLPRPGAALRALAVALLALAAPAAWAGVTLTPASATLSPGATQVFMASEPVSWSLDAGDLAYNDTEADYTAAVNGQNLPPGTYTLTATSQSDPSQSTSAVITVTAGAAPSALTVSPASASLAPGANATFTANAPVTWSLDAGSLAYNDTMAQFTASSGGQNLPPGTYTLTATGQADPSQVVRVSITVQSASAPSGPVTLTPSAATVQPGAQQAFTANQPVTWSVSAGSLSYNDTSATFTAAAGGSNLPAGTYTLTATSKADTTQTATATITVAAAAGPVTLTPSSATVQPGAQQAFTANQPVTWSVSAGSLSYNDTSATFTAAAGGSNLPAGTYTLTATSKADATQTATATITVPAAAGPVTLTPASATVQPGAQQAFTANQPVTWSVSAGSLSYNDTSATFTAAAGGSNLPAGTYTLTATSKADATQTATATITVAAPSSPVTLTPSSATVQPGAQQAFTANQPVTWSVSAGSLSYNDTSATFTAAAGGSNLPAGTYTLTATSKADATQTATATITVPAPPPPAELTLTPTSATVANGGSQVFTANQAVTWTFSAGSISYNDTTLTYRAETQGQPLPSGSYTVTATAKADPSKTITAVITVLPAPPPPIQVDPSLASVPAGAVLTLRSSAAATWSCSAGTLTASADTGATWSAADGNGQALPLGTYTVTATLKSDPTQTAVATVKVTDPNAVITVSLSPAEATVTTGGSQAFTATVTGTDNPAVTWTMSAGSISYSDTTATYTAAAGGQALPPGDYTLTATSQADGTKLASATLHVVTSKVSLSPVSAVLHPGATQLFSPSVVGLSNAAVTWAVQETGGGSMDPASGLYTAPAQPGVYHLKATSQADPSQSALAKITVLDPSASVGISISPAEIAVDTGSTTPFTATVTGSPDPSVSWEMDRGSITYSDTTASFTAPDAPGTYTLTARSQADPTKSATAQVHVRYPGAPVITACSVDKIQIQEGDAVTLSWTATGATSFTVRSREGSVPLDGSQTSLVLHPVGPDATYDLVATNEKGDDVRTVRIQVIHPAIASFTADADLVDAGQAAHLTAAFSDGEGRLDPGGIPVTSGQAVAVTPATTTAYTLTVTNAFGASVTATLTVGVRVQGAWVPTAGTMVQKRWGHQMTPLPDGRILIYGGDRRPADLSYDGLGTAQIVPGQNQGFELYDPATDAFTAIPATVAGVDHITGASATAMPGGDVLLFGGMDALPPASGQTHGTWIANRWCQYLDPNAGALVSAPPVAQTLGSSLAYPRYGHAACLLLNGQILVVGGFSGLTPNPYGDAIVIDPYRQVNGQSSTWMSEVRPVQTPGDEWPERLLLLPDGDALVYSAGVAPQKYLAKTGQFVPLLGSGQPEPVVEGAVLLLSGKVLLLGDGAWGLYDPAAGSYQAKGAVDLKALSPDQAQLLPDGRVLVPGLTGGTRSLVFDPSLGGFETLAGALPDGADRSYGAVAASTQDGRILVTGGIAGTYAPTGATLGSDSALRLDLPMAFTLSPARKLVSVGATIPFSATREGAAVSVTWSASGGTIDATGRWTAPATPGIYTVSATDAGGHTLGAQVTVIQIKSGLPAQAAVSPAAVLLEPGSDFAFSLDWSSGTQDTGFSWSVQEGDAGGTVSSGRYHAPATPGTYHVVATSITDPTLKAVATVTVASGASAGMTLTPTGASLSVGQTQVFTASAGGSGQGSASVAWQVVEPDGTITDNGDGTATFSSPTPGTFHVVALSKVGPPSVIEATVQVALPDAPKIADFSASANPIAKGQSTTLAWSVTGADSLTVTGTDGLSQTVQATGSLVVSPDHNVTYTLMASNAAGGTSSAVTIGVTQPLAWKGDRVFAFGKLISEDKAQADGSVATTYLQSDQVGSPTLVSDASGALIGRSKNLPFGERFSESGLSAQTRPFIRFAGHEGDDNTWMYMQAREYLPAYGRFAEPDPAHDQGTGDSQSWNLYGYVDNNPVTGQDPTGQWGVVGHYWGMYVAALAVGYDNQQAHNLARAAWAPDTDIRNAMSWRSLADQKGTYDNQQEIHGLTGGSASALQQRAKSGFIQMLASSNELLTIDANGENAAHLLGDSFAHVSRKGEAMYRPKWGHALDSLTGHDPDNPFIHRAAFKSYMEFIYDALRAQAEADGDKTLMVSREGFLDTVMGFVCVKDGVAQQKLFSEYASELAGPDEVVAPNEELNLKSDWRDGDRRRGNYAAQ